MGRWTTVIALAGALLGATPAAAQSRGADWSILGAETLAPGSDAVYGRFGWPDVSFGFTHGVNSTFDAGVRFGFLYGVENTSSSRFGMEFAAPLRWSLARQGPVHFLLHLDPGLRFYTFDPVLFGFQLPVGLNLEFQTRSPLKIGVGADFHAALFVTGGVTPQFFFGPLIGPYLEYHVDPHLALGFDTRFGAIIDAVPGQDVFVNGVLRHVSGDTVSRFGFRAQMMLAYRL